MRWILLLALTLAAFSAVRYAKVHVKHRVYRVEADLFNSRSVKLTAPNGEWRVMYCDYSYKGCF